MPSHSGIEESAASGPTQMDYEEAGARWRGRKKAALALRVAILASPIAASFATSFLASKHLPASKLGLNTWIWWVGVILASTVVLIGTEKVARRFLPLAALLKLSLVFPDEAPNRFKAAIRTGTARQLERRLRTLDQRDDTRTKGEHMLDMLAVLAEHDRLTRGHSERVRAYSDMLAQELHLSAADADKLHWAALLHDLGKLHVPGEILNKDGRPTDEEFEVIKGHPAAGLPYVEPLRDWLGDWLRAVDQHHERWDGRGYPKGLRGDEIHLSGRIVAVADAFDVITSARSYKKPLPAAVARQEIADCASRQFDPVVVRAFLNIGLGRLRLAIGPLAWLNSFPSLADSALLPAAGTAASGAATVAVAAVASMAGVWPADTPVTVADPPPTMAFEAEQDVEVETELAASTIRVELDEDASIEFSVAGTGGEVVRVTVVAPPAHGVATVLGAALTADGSWSQRISYSPAPDFAGADQFTYEVCGASSCARGRVDLDVVATNDAPRATIDTVDLTAGGDITVSILSVLGNDVDPDGDELRISDLRAGQGVSVVVFGDQLFVEADPDFEGSTVISYTVCDGAGACAVGTIAVTVLPPPRAPLLRSDRIVGTEDRSGTIAAALLLDNDTDPDGDPLVVRSVVAGDGVVVTLSGADIAYSPAPDRNGDVTLTYTACDPGDLCGTAAVTLSLDAVADAPVALPDAVAGRENEPGVIGAASVLANDVDVDGDVLTIAAVDSSAAVTASLVGDTIEYVPATGFVGDAGLDYTVCDPTGRCDTTTITVTIEPTANVAPVAIDDGGLGFATAEDTAFVTADVTANDSDADGPVDPAGVALAAAPAKGTAVHNGDGTFTYAPDPDTSGVDSFTYTITDASGATSAPATVVIGVAAVNDAPLATDDIGVGFTTVEDTPFVTADVTVNDADVDDPVDGASTTVATGPTKGTLVANGDGTFTYTPDADTNGTDSFAYTITDASGATSAPATVVIAVFSVNDPPVAADDDGFGFVTFEDTAFVTADVTVNDSDVDDPVDGTSAVVVVGPGNGVAAANGDGTFTYDPDPTFVGTDTFTYTITDAAGATSAPATLTIVVVNVNDPPVAADDSGLGFTTFEDTPFVTADVTLNDTDVDDPVDPTTVELDNPAAQGLAVHNGDGTFTYTPGADENGTDSFTYTIKDGAGAVSNDATVSIVVVPVNDEPTFQAGSPVSVLEGAGATTVAGWATSIKAGPANEAAQILTFDVTNDNNALFTVQPAVDPATGDLTFTPAADANGMARVTTVLWDDGGTANGGDNRSPTHTFPITITAVNDEPTFTDGGNPPTVLEDAAAQTISGWATAITAGPPDEAGQTLTFTTTANSNPGLFAVAPSVDEITGDLTYTPADDAAGDADVTFTLSDDGGTANGGDDTSVDHTVTITVVPVSDPPSLDQNATVSVPALGTVTITTVDLAASDIDNAAADLVYTVTATTTDGAIKRLGVTVGSFTQDDIDNSRITYEHTGGAGATDSFDFDLDDGTGSGTVSDTFTIAIESTGIVLSEFRPSGPDGNQDEFIEIYNLGAAGVDLGGWQLRVTGFLNFDFYTFPSVVLEPGRHFLVAHVNSPLAGSADDTWSGLDYGTWGDVVLKDDDGTPIDIVGFDSGSNPILFEGTKLPSYPGGFQDRSYERLAGGASGNCVDTDDNSADWFFTAVANPQSTSDPAVAC